MKLAILHQELEWGETALRRLLAQRGHEVSLIDVRSAHIKDFNQFDIVLNRVYASVANRSIEDTKLALSLLDRLESTGIRCINTLSSTRRDYDKYLQYTGMSACDVPTPDTIPVSSIADYRRQAEAIDRLGYPLVVKRQSGGRAEGIFKLNSATELLSCLQSLFSPAAIQRYSAGHVIQPFLRSIEPYDIRIAIINGGYSYSYSRSLVASKAGERPWIGSGDIGSVLAGYQPTVSEIELAVRASRAMGAFINEVDMLITASGPTVIENNLTPNFIPEKQHYLEALCHSLLDAVETSS